MQYRTLHLPYLVPCVFSCKISVLRPRKIGITQVRTQLFAAPYRMCSPYSVQQLMAVTSLRNAHRDYLASMSPLCDSLDFNRVSVFLWPCLFVDALQQCEELSARVKGGSGKM